jgi:uncharacterized integral membrane protein
VDWQCIAFWRLIGGISMFRNVIFICLIAVVLIFVFQNMQTIEVKFLVWTMSVSRALLLLITLAIGLIGGSLLAYPRSKRKVEKKR